MSVSISCSRIWNQLHGMFGRQQSQAALSVPPVDVSAQIKADAAGHTRRHGASHTPGTPKPNHATIYIPSTSTTLPSVLLNITKHSISPAAQQQSTTVTVHHCVHQHRTTAADCYPRSKHLLTPTRALLVLTRRFITVNSDLRQCMHIGASESGTQTGDGSASAILRPSTTATGMMQLQYDKTKSDITFIHFNTTLVRHRQTDRQTSSLSRVYSLYIINSCKSHNSSVPCSYIVLNLLGCHDGAAVMALDFRSKRSWVRLPPGA